MNNEGKNEARNKRYLYYSLRKMVMRSVIFIALGVSSSIGILLLANNYCKSMDYDAFQAIGFLSIIAIISIFLIILCIDKADKCIRKDIEIIYNSLKDSKNNDHD